jgi:hypothetical protein
MHCDSCQFWVKPGEEVGVTQPRVGEFGTCHRLPPMGMLSGFPATKPTDWCGQFKPREK